MSSIKLDSLLTNYGLIRHTFAFNDLPQNIKFDLGDENKEHYQDCFLSLIANAGPKFWTELKNTQHEWGHSKGALDNPVDYFSTVVVEQLLQVTGLAQQAKLLYPGTAPAPLMQLGELANWSTPSPLGLGLHAHYGPWFAYRALVKTTDPLPAPTSTIDALTIQAIPATQNNQVVLLMRRPISSSISQSIIILTRLIHPAYNAHPPLV